MNGIRNDGNFNSLTAGRLISKGIFGLPIQTKTILSDQPGQMLFDPTHNHPFYSVDSRVWVPFGIGTPGGTITFAPGYTGDSSYIFSSWQDTINALNFIDGFKYLIIDNQFGPVVIPPGAWDMTLIEWFAPASRLSTMGTTIPVIVQDGATLNGLCGITGPIKIEYQGTTTACITVDQVADPIYEAFRFNYAAGVKCSGTQPFIDIVAGNFLIVMDVGTTINLMASPCFTCQNGIQATIGIIGASVIIEDNTLAPALGGIMVVANWITSTVISVPLIQAGAGTNFLVQLSNPFVYKNQSAFPTVNDDDSLFYRPGDVWISINPAQVMGHRQFINVDNTAGASVWRSSPITYSFAGVPGVTDDVSKGFLPGDFWIDITGPPTIQINIDNTVGAAIWSPVV